MSHRCFRCGYHPEPCPVTHCEPECPAEDDGCDVSECGCVPPIDLPPRVAALIKELVEMQPRCECQFDMNDDGSWTFIAKN